MRDSAWAAATAWSSAPVRREVLADGHGAAVCGDGGGELGDGGVFWSRRASVRARRGRHGAVRCWMTPATTAPRSAEDGDHGGERESRGQWV